MHVWLCPLELMVDTHDLRSNQSAVAQRHTHRRATGVASVQKLGDRRPQPPSRCRAERDEEDRQARALAEQIERASKVQRTNGDAELDGGDANGGAAAGGALEEVQQSHELVRAEDDAPLTFGLAGAQRVAADRLPKKLAPARAFAESNGRCGEPEHAAYDPRNGPHVKGFVPSLLVDWTPCSPLQACFLTACLQGCAVLAPLSVLVPCLSLASRMAQRHAHDSSNALLGRGDAGERNGGAAAAGANGRGKSKLELLMEQDKAAKASQQARQAQTAAKPATNGST